MWIFAYGSLIFRPAFAFAERRRAFVSGWSRRFWQGSPDHRGTPERPGRVVTLVTEAGGWCGGSAYRVAPEELDAVLDGLDAREQAGFERHLLPLWDDPASASAFGEGLVYVAAPSNPHFLGPLEEPAIASWIAESHGPSGPNADYARLLHASLRELGIDDPHVTSIAAHLAAIATVA